MRNIYKKIVKDQHYQVITIFDAVLVQFKMGIQFRYLQASYWYVLLIFNSSTLINRHANNLLTM